MDTHRLGRSQSWLLVAVAACGSTPGGSSNTASSAPPTATGERQRLTSGDLDVTAVIPAGARLEPRSWTDDADGRTYAQVRIHLDHAVVEVSRYDRPCKVGDYGDGSGGLSLLSSDELPDGYALTLESFLVDCDPGAAPGCVKRGTTPRLAVEVCSTATRTVCQGDVARDDDAGAAALTALCRSIAKAP